MCFVCVLVKLHETNADCIHTHTLAQASLHPTHDNYTIMCCCILTTVDYLKQLQFRTGATSVRLLGYPLSGCDLL